MKLANLLSAEQILLDMEADHHWTAIVELVDHLVRIGQLPASHYDAMLDSFRVREELLSTGIGSGVAIPHAFSDHLENVVAVFGRSKAGIDFTALDNAPVHLIILFIVPRTNYHLHLKTLAAIAKIFVNREILEQLNAAEVPEEVLAILDLKPSRAGA
jgi:mannitol/fructose-specific phosphotransferase system IIA component (Ntr-type)